MLGLLTHRTGRLGPASSPTWRSTWSQSRSWSTSVTAAHDTDRPSDTGADSRHGPGRPCRAARVRRRGRRADRGVPRRRPGSRSSASVIRAVVDVAVVAVCVAFVFGTCTPTCCCATPRRPAATWAPTCGALPTCATTCCRTARLAGWTPRLVRRLPRVPVLHGAAVAADRAAQRRASTARRRSSPAVAGIRRASAQRRPSARPAPAPQRGAGRSGRRPSVSSACPTASPSSSSPSAASLTLPVVRLRLRPPGRPRFPDAGGARGRDAAVPLLPGLHDLRRQHPVDAGGRVRLLDLAQPRPPLPRGRVQGAGDRPLPGAGRGAAGPHRAVPPHPGVLGARRHRHHRGGPVPAALCVADPGPACSWAGVRSWAQPGCCSVHRRRCWASPCCCPAPRWPPPACGCCPRACAGSAPTLVVGGLLSIWWVGPFYLRSASSTTWGGRSCPTPTPRCRGSTSGGSTCAVRHP